jgi:hypothetical protein
MLSERRNQYFAQGFSPVINGFSHNPKITNRFLEWPMNHPTGLKPLCEADDLRNYACEFLQIVHETAIFEVSCFVIGSTQD